MSAQTIRKQVEQETIINNIDENIAMQTNDIDQQAVAQTVNVDEDKLAKLRQKLAAKTKEMEMVKEHSIIKRDKSINFGVIGSGQAGSNLAATFYKLGYDAVVINTAHQDLKFIDVPESNKLHLAATLGGAAKDLEIGKNAAEQFREQIVDLIQTQLADAQVLLLAFSLGGGSGAGSCEVLVDICASIGKPVAVISVLPMLSEDAQVKSNALKTLSKLSKFAQDKKINNLILVDNAKIEAIYHNVGQMDFYRVANNAIAEILDSFNTFSSQPSNVKSLDPLEWAKILVDGGGLSTFGEMTVSNYKDETAIAEAVINNLNGNLLAEGFDLKQARYAGIIIVANDNTWKEISSASINYAMAIVNDLCNNPLGVYKGVYSAELPDNVVKIYSLFSGLALPASRIDGLIKETAQLQESHKNKDINRDLSLKLDTGKDNVVTKVEEIKQRINQKTSAFGKLVGAGVVDRRK